jgi:hypothetical protein
MHVQEFVVDLVTNPGDLLSLEKFQEKHRSFMRKYFNLGTPCDHVQACRGSSSRSSA